MSNLIIRPPQSEDQMATVLEIQLRTFFLSSRGFKYTRLFYTLVPQKPGNIHHWKLKLPALRPNDGQGGPKILDLNSKSRLYLKSG